MPRASIAGKSAPATITINTGGAPAPVETPAADATPPKPEAEQSPRAFFDRIQEFPAQDWGRVWSLELHRKEPAIPGVPGSKGFLTLFLNPTTVSEIKQRYGGGKFQLNLCKNGRWQTSYTFDVEGEPKYDMDKERPQAAAQNGNGNGDSAIVKEFITVLREELKSSREANQGAAPGSDKVIDMLVSAADRAQEMVAKATPQATSQTQQLSEIVTIVKALVPQPSTSPFNALLEKAIPALLEKFLAPVDPMAQITMYLTIFEKLNALRGEGGGGGAVARDWKAMAVQEGLTRAPEILKELRETFAVNRDTAQARQAAAEANARALEAARQLPPAAAAHVAAAVTHQPTPHVPDNTVMPNGPLRTVPIDRAATDAPPAQVAPAGTAANGEAPNAAGFSKSESDAVAKFVRAKIVEMITDDRDAEDVVEFIEEVDYTLNDMLIAYPAEMITTSLASDSVLSKVVSLPGWPAFLEDARAYIREIRAEQEKAAHTAQAAPA